MTGSGGCCMVCKIAKGVAGLGALNWGLVALFDFNLVERLLGMGTAAKIVYVIIGVAGLLALASFANLCPCTKGGSCAPKS